MTFHEDILQRYLSVAPVPLAFERFLEARIYRRHAFPRPILDIGCGDGIFVKAVFREKVDTGIDPDPREVSRARELGAYDELLECGGAAISKPDGHYNTVFSNSVLEHIRDIEPVLREAHRLLARGGKFYVTVPSHRFDEFSVVNQVLCALGLTSLAARFRAFFNRFWRHYHCYTPEAWSALVQRAGFTVTEIHTYGPKRICLLNDFLAPFSIISFVIKKLTDRWVLFPGLRSILMTPIAMAGKRLLEGADVAQDGGLVFMELTKA
jgi:SAM-dependent methyltransferase